MRSKCSPKGVPERCPRGEALGKHAGSTEVRFRVTWVGPAGVLVVADSPRVATAFAQEVWKAGGGRIPVLPAVLAPSLKEPQGRSEGVLAFRDEEAIRDYLRGGYNLDGDEVKRIAAWLKELLSEGNTSRKPPPPWEVRILLPRFKLFPTGKSHKVSASGKQSGSSLRPRSVRPLYSKGRFRRFGWRLLFLPELLLFAILAPSSSLARLWVGVLLLRFFALFGDDPLYWKRFLLLFAGGLELAFVWVMVQDGGESSLDWLINLSILVPGLFSVLWGLRLFWPGLLPEGNTELLPEGNTERRSGGGTFNRVR